MSSFFKINKYLALLLLLGIRNHYIILAQDKITDSDIFYKDSISGPVHSTPNPYLLPPVFKGEFLFNKSFDLPSLFGEKKYYLFLHEEKHNRLDSMRINAYRSFLYNNPHLIKYKSAELEKINREQPKQEVSIFRKIFDIDIDTDLESLTPIERITTDRGTWKIEGNSLLQFSQNYISNNWYKGGVGNFNLLSVQNFSANYQKKKIKFNNFIEWKLSFYTNPNDSLRNFRIGEDLIKTYSDFGIQAFNNKWSYSTNFELKTQLFKNYYENTNDILSSALSPLYIKMGILGMKYNMDKTYENNKHKKLHISTDISPLSIQYTGVLNKKVDPARFGIDNGKRHSLNFGSTINSKLVINFNKQVRFSSRFQLFTNYEKIIAESENELNLALSRYFSTRIYIYCRYDDTPGIEKDKKFGFFQFNELLSFGLNFKW